MQRPGASTDAAAPTGADAPADAPADARFVCQDLPLVFWRSVRLFLGPGHDLPGAGRRIVLLQMLLRPEVITNLARTGVRSE